MHELAALVGETSPSFMPLEGSLDTFLTPVDVEGLVCLLERHPGIQNRSLKVDRALADQRIVAREWLPDPEFTLGIESNRVENENSFLFGLSIPLPIFNRNQGLLEAAQASVDSARASQNAASFKLTAEVRALAAQSEGFRKALATYDELTLPQFRKSNELVQEGFALGEFGYLEAIESQSAQIDAELERLEIIEKLLEVQVPLVSLDRFLKASERTSSEESSE